MAIQVDARAALELAKERLRRGEALTPALARVVLDALAKAGA